MTPTDKYSRYYTYIKPVINSAVVKQYGAWSLTIITMIIFIIFAIKPTIETISVLQQKLENSKQTLIQVNQKLQNLQTGRKNYEALGANTLNKINLAVPTQISLNTLIQPLELAATVNQASISALQIDPVVITQKDPNSNNFTLEKVQFTFNTEGSFTNIMRLLQDLEQSERLISIDSVVLNKAPDSSTILMSVVGKAYYLK